MKNIKGLTLLSLIITIIILIILIGVAINVLFDTDSLFTNAQDTVTLSNIQRLEEKIYLYKTGKNLNGITGEEAYPIAKNEDGTYINLAQMKTKSELNKLSNDLKYTLLNLTNIKGTNEIPTLEDIDYTKFYQLDKNKINISEKEVEDLVIFIKENKYKVISLAGVSLQKQKINVIIPLNNVPDPEYITVENNTYKLYGNGTLKVLGEKTVNAGYTYNEVDKINNSLDKFDIEQINSDFGNPMKLPAKDIYFSTGTVYVIDADNELWAWGANEFNKLGLGHSYLITEPTKILEGRCGSTKVCKVWAGATNTFIVDLNGKIYGCGTNNYGELGIGKGVTTDKYVEIAMPISLNGNNIEYMSLSEKTNKGVTIIKFENGQVFAMGFNEYGEFGNGTKTHLYTLTELTHFRNCKYIQTSGDNTIIIDNRNDLYLCGMMYMPNQQLVLEPLKILANIKQAQTCSTTQINGITLTGEVFTLNNSAEPQIISSIPKDTNAILLSENYILTNDAIYNISGNKVWTNMTNITKYYETDNLNGENTDMTVLKSNNKIYVYAMPDITKIKEKSNYELRTVFENAIYVQGQGKRISIVDKQGKIYESITGSAITSVTNARKIIASDANKYVITEDNRLYARGEVIGSIWGVREYKADYQEIKNEQGQPYNKVKNVFTLSTGGSVIVQTTDNKLYWGGSRSRITLPRNTGK